MALITQKDVDDIKGTLAELAPFTEEPITYRTFTEMIPGDPVLGTPDTPGYADTAETAGVRELSLEEVQVSGGAYVLGDVEFTVRRQTKPKYEDRIAYGGSSYKPKSIGKLFLGEVLWWEIKAGKE